MRFSFYFILIFSTVCPEIRTVLGTIYGLLRTRILLKLLFRREEWIGFLVWSLALRIVDKLWRRLWRRLRRRSILGTEVFPAWRSVWVLRSWLGLPENNDHLYLVSPPSLIHAVAQDGDLPRLDCWNVGLSELRERSLDDHSSREASKLSKLSHEVYNQA